MAVDIHYYIISLDDNGFMSAKQKLLAIGVDEERIFYFKGVKGNEKRSENKYTEKYPELPFVPSSTFGCAEAHRKVNNLLNKTYKDSEIITVVLEDDATPSVTNENEILSTIKMAMKAHTDWDVLRLHCYGPCGDKLTNFNKPKTPFPLLGPLSGSTMAYVPSKSGRKKISKTRPNAHIDAKMALTPSLVERTTSATLFGEKEDAEANSTTSGNYFPIDWNGIFGDASISGLKLSRVVQYRMLRIPGFEIELSTGDIMIIVIMLIIVFGFYKTTTKKRHMQTIY